MYKEWRVDYEKAGRTTPRPHRARSQMENVRTARALIGEGFIKKAVDTLTSYGAVGDTVRVLLSFGADPSRKVSIYEGTERAEMLHVSFSSSQNIIKPNGQSVGQRVNARLCQSIFSVPKSR